MLRKKLINKGSRVSIAIALISIVSMSFAFFAVRDVAAQQASIGVDPSLTTVGNANEVIPAAGLPFNVNLTVSDVTDLFAWQAQIYFLPSIVNFTGASYPPGHVFDGKDPFQIDPDYEYVEESLPQNLSNVDPTAPIGSVWRWRQMQEFTLTDWIDTDNTGNLTVSDLVWLNRTDTGLIKYYGVKAIEVIPNRISMTVEIAYILVGEALLGADVPTFNGDGVLIKLGFKGLAVGSSMLNFSRVADECYLANSTADGSDRIPFQIADGRVNILGQVAGKEPSEITLDVNPSAVKVGSNVTLSGSISPTKANVDVTIYYRLEGVSVWSTLGTVKTNQQSQYSYTWTTSSTGTYYVKAGWQGDPISSGDESDTRTVTITTEEPPGTDYTLYIIGAIVIVVIVVVVVYLLRRRKR